MSRSTDPWRKNYNTVYPSGMHTASNTMRRSGNTTRCCRTCPN